MQREQVIISEPAYNPSTTKRLAGTILLNKLIIHNTKK